MTATRPQRSALYMPASNARAIDKARTLACDVVILDLEDAVAPEAKAAARLNACEAVRAGGFGQREVVIRINGLNTPWGRDDLAAASAAAPNAVLVPKISEPADLVAYDAALRGSARLWAMIETCRSAFRLDALAGAGAALRVEAWVIGSNDVAKEMRCRLDAAREPLRPFLGSAVMAAHAHGLAILDGVFNDIEDDEGLAGQCRQGADFGFDGKTLIHPRQIAAANAAFSPDPEEVAWSKVVVEAFKTPEAADKGVLRIDGRMVERLHLAQAERTLSVAQAIRAAENT